MPFLNPLDKYTCYPLVVFENGSMYLGLIISPQAGWVRLSITNTKNLIILFYVVANYY
jgi:hypothetical protein